MKYLFIILLTLSYHSKTMSQDHKIQVQCDSITGLCDIPDFEDNNKTIAWNDDEELFYIGDPMCSWCWGISPQINALQCYANQEHIPFNLIMGGLRPGGGEAWDTAFKRFLEHHWQQVHEKSGQPFSYELFEKDEFNYDTEPACRAVITARSLAPEKTLAFYELVQHYFYTKSKDPKQVDFYKVICETLDIDFQDFSDQFTSESMKLATQADFTKSRELGVRGFPSIIYRHKDQLYNIASGYTEFEDLKAAILKLKAKNED
ncbi:DsbA family protein [Winogradskyella forsetii]|uniref:DsbA family protein n=2 Tax=Winogradskyella forsetii TaxID=2686077 RepID=UPI001C545D19|nr:DsbA family protein [Winogradskyella forsetii]